MKVSVNLDLCVGHARCQDKCPEVYGTDTALGKCQILLPDVPDHLKEGARLGALNCPEGAITVQEDSE